MYEAVMCKPRAHHAALRGTELLKHMHNQRMTPNKEVTLSWASSTVSVATVLGKQLEFARMQRTCERPCFMDQLLN
jgi:hypothetical protein